ncbi:GNAT family N-acetyltransferase [Paenibacillus shenyangensis]|uniref:GNAT family N-acetyltransferase n=1 Tax=Paenibacillus sp. A9 TaxID=1284352 RepID=UPI0003701572|nr:GNAT family N-acetyltransferase [Paenibacillus sp. A9]
MKNPIKELKGIKDSINEAKQAMDGIKATLNDVKSDVDEAKQNLQHTMEHAKETSQEAKASTDQLKSGIQNSKTAVQDTRNNLSSATQDVKQSVTIVKEEFNTPGGGFAADEEQTKQTGSNRLSASRTLPSSDSQLPAMQPPQATAITPAYENPGAELIEGGQLIKEGTAFFLKKGEEIVGEITYIPGPESDTWTLNHTYVNPEYRGGKIAQGLLDQVVQAARAENKKILPTCSYALAQFKRHSQYEDVWMRY